MGTELAVASLILSAIGTGANIKNAADAKSDARRQRKLQEQQQRLQQRAQEAQQLRQKRIRVAQLNATAGATGVGSTAVTGGVTAIGSQTAGQLDLLKSQGELQRSQFALQEDILSSKANAAIGESIGSFTSNLFAPLDTSKDAPQGIENTLLGKALGK